MSNAAPQFRTELRQATYEDCLTLAPNLRQEDKDEVWESHSHLPEEALLESLKASPDAQVATVDGEVICMFGVAPTLELDVGIPWLLGTPRIKEFSTEFLKRNKPVLSGISSGYKLLVNYVWSRNTEHIRWLQWLGFTIIRTPIFLGRNREIFYSFYMYQKE